MISPFAKQIFILLAKLRAKEITSKEIDIEVRKLQTAYGVGMLLLERSK